MRMNCKQLPNLLTAGRLCSIVPFLFFFFEKKFEIALYVFLAAGLTDALDGWLARHFHWQSLLGLFLDPIADKLLIVLSFFSLAWVQILPWWLIILVLFRDLSILVGVLAWYYVMRREIDFKPSILSKINTFMELLLVCYCLLSLVFALQHPWILDALIGVVALTTILSHVGYLWMWAKKASVQTVMYER